MNKTISFAVLSVCVYCSHFGKNCGYLQRQKRVKALHCNRQDAMRHYHHKDNKGRRNQPKKNN